MSVFTDEEKVLLFDVHLTVSAAMAYTPMTLPRAVEEGFPFQGHLAALDEACRAWLRYRAREADVTSVDNLDLSVRACNVFQNNHIRTIDQVRALTDDDYKRIGLSAKIHRRAIREALEDWDAKQKQETARGRR